MSVCMLSRSVPDHIVRHGMVPGYEREGLFDIAEVMGRLPPLQPEDDSYRYSLMKLKRYGHALPDDPFSVEFAGRSVTLANLRMHTFAAHGMMCVTCGLEGRYFALERHAKYVHRLQQWLPLGDGHRWSMNLYGLRPDGCEMMLTRDHIRPRAKGGVDTLENSQPMCASCNNTKGDRWVEDG